MAKQAIPDTKRGTYFWVEPERLKVVTDRTHPLYDPRAEWPPDDELVESIRRLGVLEPVAVRRNGDDLEVVFGRRRVVAAVELNRRIKREGGEPVKVPTLKWDGTDAEARCALLAENAVRQDDPPGQLAQKLSYALKIGCQVGDLAQALGVTADTIRNKLKLLELAAPVLKAVDGGQLGEAVARKLSVLSRDEQVAEWDRMQSEGATKGAKAVKRVEERTKGTSKETGGRMMRRSDVNRWLDELADNEGDLSGLVVGVLHYVLGDQDALGGRYRGYRPKSE